VESTQYTEKAFVMTRAFIKHALQNAVSSFEDILAWHYLPGPVDKDSGSARPQLLRKAISEALSMIGHYNSTRDNTAGEDRSVASPFIARLSLGAVVMLRKHIAILEKIFSVAERWNNAQVRVSI
jgi:ubiquitin-conjugating enzyme E2 O